MNPRIARNRKLLIGVLLAAILGGGWFIFHGKSKADADGVQIVKPETGSIEETVTAQGKLEAKEYVDVGVQVSGQLKKLYVEIGDVVKKGDLLAEIDPQIYQSRLEADQAHLQTLIAGLAEQEAQVVYASQQNERNERLIKSNAISKQALETTGNDLKVAETRVASSKAQIKEQQSTLQGDKANLSYTKIYAPMNGTVVLQNAREGQTLNANQSAPLIVQLANLDVMTVRVQVAEADVSRLKAGMDVYFTTLGSLDKRWKGTVRQILPSPEVINDVVLYDALIDVDNKDRQLMTGMSTQVFFLIGSAEDVMTIPVTALGKAVKGQDNTYIVKTKAGNKTVKTGLMDRNVVQVISGLDKNDEIIIPVKKLPAKPAQGGGGGGMRGMPRI